MTSDEAIQTMAWQANRMRQAEEVIAQLSQQCSGLAQRAKTLEEENVALKEQLGSEKTPEGLS